MQEVLKCSLIGIGIGISIDVCEITFFVSSKNLNGYDYRLDQCSSKRSSLVSNENKLAF